MLDGADPQSAVRGLHQRARKMMRGRSGSGPSMGWCGCAGRRCAPPLPGGSDPDNQTISSDPEGTIWAVASNVYAMRGGIARRYRFPGVQALPIRNVSRDRPGMLWIGTDGSGAYRLTPSGVIHYSAPRRLANNFVRAQADAVSREEQSCTARCRRRLRYIAFPRRSSSWGTTPWRLPSGSARETCPTGHPAQ